jgi:Nif-specific regulatory protein
MDSGRATLLYDIGQKLASLTELDELLPYLIGRIKDLFAAESAAVLLLDPEGNELHFPWVDDRDPARVETLRAVRMPRDRGFAGWVVAHGEPLRVDDAASDPRFYPGVDRITGRTTRDLLGAPLRTRRGVIGVVEVINGRSGSFSADDLEFLDALSGSVAVAIENANLLAEVRSREALLRREVVSLRRVAAGASRWEGIVGSSAAMKEVFDLMESAVETPINVLIEGETGTGKELVARAIHYHGLRRDRAFVAINCAALNDNLLESELFGHRRGAFTGALRDKKGLLEVADEGTVFLDEIGETSPAFQAKLLRVLQEGEFVPVGDVHPRRVDLRVISATNRNLPDEIRAARFREDLYYRIAAFPIAVPPLRERVEDIPLLVDHLLGRIAERLGREAPGIDPQALAFLEGYSWPGNVRDLQNELERAVSLTPRGARIGVAQISRRVREGDRPREDRDGAPLSLRGALERSEREHLKRALAANGGNVSQTARAVGISRVALQRKMKAFGLRGDPAS